jgi:hypothetical protein
MAVPSIFSEKGSQAIASYDWLDITSGTGYRKYYACSAQDSASTKYFLTTRTMDANPITVGLSTSNVAGLFSDTDFDVSFAVPAMVKGTALVNLTHYLNTTNTESIVVNIYHVSLTAVETLIGTATTVELVTTGSETHNRECLKIALTQKHFGVGETLRLNIIQNGRKNAAGSSTVSYYTDPSSRTSLTETGTGTSLKSDLVLDVPFKIDL